MTIMAVKVKLIEQARKSEGQSTIKVIEKNKMDINTGRQKVNKLTEK